MSNNYLIFTDSSTDIPAEAVAGRQLSFIPMDYSTDDTTYVSTGTESDEELFPFYERLKSGELPHTSQITPNKYCELMAPYLEKGHSVLYLALSSGLSSTYDSACLAAQMLKEDYPDVDFVPLDSLAATGVEGLILEHMLENRDKGMGIFENKEDTAKYISSVRGFAYVESLMHLSKGGRISTTAAVFGSALNIKPIIILTPDGKLVVHEKRRGENKSLQCMADFFKEQYDFDVHSPVYIIDCMSSAAADKLQAMVLEICPDAKIRRRCMTQIIGVHLGPGGLVLSFQKKPGIQP